MALPADMEAELRSMLRALRAAHGPASIPTGAGKALEAWVLVRLASAAKALPTWNVTLRRGDGTPLGVGEPFRLPDQPSRIPPSNVAGPCYVLLQHTQHPCVALEIRGGVQWKGRSGALHECDVSVLPANIGEAIRNHGGGNPQGLPVATIECKDKASAGSLDEVRQTLARLFDLALVTRPSSRLTCRIFESNTGIHWGRRRTTYVSLFACGTFGIARAGDFQSGAKTLAEHYHIGRFDWIYDTTGVSMMRMMQSFRQTLSLISTF